jgi:hypothetical protein
VGTFWAGIGFGGVGVESAGHAGDLPLLLNDGVIVDLLLEILELASNGSAGPGPVEVDIGLVPAIRFLELDALPLASSAHVEDMQ